MTVPPTGGYHSLFMPKEVIYIARTRKQDREQKAFNMPDETIRPVPAKPPQVRARQELINNPAARTLASATLGELRKAFLMKPVQSNHELIERLDEYFSLAQDRQVPPTVEEMALYCGFTAGYLNDLKNERRKGWNDVESGLTTAAIIKRAMDILHGFDAVQALSGKANPVVYIFRSKCYHDMVEKHEISIVNNSPLQQPLTPEEIAKNLPEMIDNDLVDLFSDMNQ